MSSAVFGSGCCWPTRCGTHVGALYISISHTKRDGLVKLLSHPSESRPKQNAKLRKATQSYAKLRKATQSCAKLRKLHELLMSHATLSIMVGAAVAEASHQCIPAIFRWSRTEY